ncbi:MAG: murein biosynthesis integral membrane protein MurJ [Woeseiaceae bacterium]
MSTENGPETAPNDDPDAKRSVTSGRRLLQSTSVVSGMTLISRILGLVRDMVFARFFATSIVMDAFLVANRIPNMLRRFFAEGAFSQGFVPVMADYRENHSHSQARQFVDAMAGTFAIILFVVTLIGVIAAPILVAIVAPGFIGDGGDFDLATMMLRFTFPYLFFVSLTAFAGGILNTYGRFAATAFSPVILNVVLISAVYWWAPNLEEPGMALAYAVFIAGVLQLLFQLPFLMRIKALPRPKWKPSHDGVRRSMRLMLPAIFGSSVAQINVLVGGIIASMLGVGKISLLYYSDRLMEFPLGLFGIALATVTLPFLSRQYANGAHEQFSATIDWSMKLVLLIAVPAAIGLIVLAEPLVATIFYGGSFTYDDVRMTGLALRAFAIGLVGFSFVKILAPAYFARHDTMTPVRIGLIALAVNFVLSVVLAWYLTSRGYAGNHAGLALAISVAALLNAWLLYRGLRRDNVLTHSPGWKLLIIQTFIASVVMAAVVDWLNRPLAWWIDSGVMTRAGWLAVTIIAGAGIYALVLLSLGMRIANLGMKPR